MPGQKHFHEYNLLIHKIVYPVPQIIFPGCSIQQIAQAMINAVTKGYEKPVLEVIDIKKLAAVFLIIQQFSIDCDDTEISFACHYSSNVRRDSTRTSTKTFTRCAFSFCDGVII
jgi:hypothetical protein